MVRINLLPREITDKRKFETRIGWVVLIGLAAVAVIAVVFIGLMLVVAAQNSELQQQLQANAQVSEQAQAYAIFEQKEGELAARSAIAEMALAERVEWARITNELSLVLPTDMWLERMDADEAAGVSLFGFALDPATDSPDVGYTSIAAMMVRLSELDLLSSVWLNSAEKTSLGEEEWQESVIHFDVSAAVVDPTAEETQDAESSVPAPPSQPAE